MPIEEKSVGMQDGKIKYCVECGAKVPGAQKVCPACGESQ
jgi:hypothetical protein